jgi:hypothetical protein
MTEADTGPDADRLPGEGKQRRRAPSFIGVGCLLVVLAAVPACSSSPTMPQAATASTVSTTSTSSTTPTTSSVTLPEQNPAELAACASDAQSVQTALTTYMAEKGSYPVPPAPWSAAKYASNYAPLTGATDGGPFLQSAPGVKYYVIEYDAAGHVWVAPPGSFGPYNKGQDFALQPNICEPAVG